MTQSRGRRDGPARADKAFVALLLWVLAWCGAGGAAAQGNHPPDIILLLVDDMGWDIAALGHPHVKTPNLDRLASEGRVFDHYYVASPVCSPTRVSFMTGHHSSRFGIHDFLSSDPRTNARRGMPNYLDPNVTTVADIARRAGYRTGHFGKGHISRGPSAPDLGEYGLDEHRTTWVQNRTYWSTSAHKHVEAAIEFLEANEDRPTYMNLWLFQMHTPVVASSAQKEVYEGETFPVADFQSHMGTYAATIPEAHERFLEYNAAMTSVDAAVGTLLDYLDRSGLADNTLLFFTSDNGPEDFRADNAAGTGNAGRFRGRKRSIYEGGIHMPCIARWPGVIPAGTVDENSIMSSIDWLPTVASLVGGEAPPNIEGEDMLEVLKGTPAAREKPLFWEFRSPTVDPFYDAPRFAVREGRWKYLWEEGTGEAELYDLLADPEERINLATEEAELAAGLEEKIRQFDRELTPTAPRVEFPLPAEASRHPGESISLRVEAGGTPPPSYRWFHNGAPLADGPGVEGSETHLLQLDGLELEDSGNYRCRISNRVGAMMTERLNLTVLLAPEITAHPVSLYLWDGGEARFRVAVRASGPLHYQWERNGVPVRDGSGIQGSNSPELVLAGVSAPVYRIGEAGYRCRISNPLGEALSHPASLAVALPGTTAFGSWIRFHLEDPVPPYDHGAHSDQDGWNDFLEFAGLSDPGREQSRPYFAVRIAGDKLEVAYDRWQGGEEKGFGRYETHLLRYELEILEQDQWQPLREPVLLERVDARPEGTGERAVYRSLSAFARGAAVLRLKVTGL